MENNYYNLFNIIIFNFLNFDNKSQFENMFNSNNLKKIKKSDWNSTLKTLKNSMYKKTNIHPYRFKTVENKHRDNEVALYFYNNQLIQIVVQLFYKNKETKKEELNYLIKLIKEISLVNFTYQSPMSYEAWRGKNNLDYRVNSVLSSIAISVIHVPSMRKFYQDK